MKKYLLFTILFATVVLSAQKNQIDTLLLDKMIVAKIDIKIPVGTKINTNCSLADEHYYVSPHPEAPKLAYITDYVLCNNGTAQMFFEVYDGKKFVFVKDYQVTFNKDVDSDNIKVLLSRRTAQEKAFVRDNIQQLVDFGKDYFTEEKEKEMSVERREAMQPFYDVEKYGIGFIKYNATEGYSSTGAYFKIFNASKKTIKYIWFTFAGENAVNDLVRLSNGSYYTTAKGIGPLESYGVSTWSFDYVWFTDIVEYLRISTVKIQYMDGSVKTVKYNDDMYIGEDAYNKLNNVLNEQDKYVEEKQKKELYVDTQKIYTEADQNADFPGGINAFRSRVIDTFDTSAMKGDEGTVKTEVSFIIERDGSITYVQAIGPNSDFNSEAVRTIKRIRTKWLPAKIGNEAVRFRFRLPLTMNFSK